MDPENPIIPVFLVVGGTLYLGYAQLNRCILSSLSFLVVSERHLALVCG